MSPEADRVVCCTTCRVVIAEFGGGDVIIELGILARAMNSHLNHLQNELTRGIEHNFVTRFRGGEFVDGVYLEKKEYIQ